MSDDNPLLRDLWYFALPGGAIRPGHTVHRRLLGEPLLIGRGADGRPFALRDICPHRAMPLSYGHFDGREIECAYHGWRFDTAGSCTHIPSLVAEQTRDVSRIRVRRYPCAEVQGNVWVFVPEDHNDTAAGDTAADENDIPRVPGFDDKGYALAQSTVFPCHVDYAVVGLMDPAHGPFVHRAWWWRSGGSIHEKSKSFAPSHLGFRMLRHAPSTNSRAYRILGGTPETEITFQLPGVRIEHVRTGVHQLGGLTAVTPIDEKSTRVDHVIYWTIPWLNALKPLVRVFARAFLNQDRRVVERQQQGLACRPRLMLIDDADTQARWYYKLKEELLRARRESRPFVNPVTERVLRWRS